MPEQLSLKSELVVVRTDDGKPSSAIALTRDSNSAYYLVHLFGIRGEDDKSKETEPQRKRAKVDPELAQAIEKIFERKLTHFVMVASHPKRLQDQGRTAWWIFVRGKANVAITAIVDYDSGVHRNPEGWEFIETLGNTLSSVADSEPNKRNDAIESLGKLCDEISARDAEGD